LRRPPVTAFSALFEERYGTALLADAAFRAGVAVGLPDGLYPLDRQSKLAGPVVTVEANNDLVSIMDAVDKASPGEVVVIANRTKEVALIGDLIASEAARKGLAGFVVDGRVRDTVELEDIGVPVFCRGPYPVGPLKLPAALKSVGATGTSISVRGVTVDPGMWVFADADGLLLFESGALEAVFDGAETALEREQDLASLLASGTALAEVLQLQLFLTNRSTDPDADFNTHLKKIGRAI
jgi:regulator of RNase E activity RraA